MEMWEWIVLLIASIVGMIVMISIATNYFRTEYIPKEIVGDKELAIDDILRLVYKCYENNEGKKGSVVCYNVEIKVNEEIGSSDILEKIDNKKIDKSQVESDNLGKSGEIVIIYENQIINIKKVENERIST